MPRLPRSRFPNMFVPAIRIALSKCATPEGRSTLEAALVAAADLERIESAFEDKVNASKAARGEKPTQLSKARRVQVRSYAEDAGTLQREQLALYEAELTSEEIARALRAGLESSLQFWSGAAKHTHQADMPVVEEFVAAKRRLCSLLEEFLASRGAT